MNSGSKNISSIIFCSVGLLHGFKPKDFVKNSIDVIISNPWRESDFMAIPISEVLPEAEHPVNSTIILSMQK